MFGQIRWEVLLFGCQVCCVWVEPNQTVLVVRPCQVQVVMVWIWDVHRSGELNLVRLLWPLLAGWLVVCVDLVGRSIYLG